MSERIKAWVARRGSPRTEPLPDYGRLYFDHLLGEYRSLPAASIDPDVKSIADTLLAKKQQTALTWDDLYTFDLMLARLAPSEKLRRKVWSLRSRYRDIAGLREYEAYLASKPPDPEGQVEEVILRADIEYLLGQLYLRYAIMPVRERERMWLSTRVAWSTIIGLLILEVFVFAIARSGQQDIAPFHAFGSQIPIQATTLTVVLFVGAMGGLISMQQRFQSASNEGDLIENVAQLRQGRSSVLLSPVSGAVFAAVLYLIIAAGLLKGDLFPLMTHVGASDEQAGNGVKLFNFIRDIEPEKYSDYAKLMVWSFLAGFAERLVPDTLSRFVEQGTSKSGGKA
jgi:hypothetical protein